ncbi:LysM peptidoglycan-binding domain-containing protein [Nonomuraea sp. B10E15]|uniref:LysM peptidoglycan-binding domain-containing protein n=1 Tax=Nonomuraea sp. B10E15 TaxID=3153560 RepID=UPI00325F240C
MIARLRSRRAAERRQRRQRQPAPATLRRRTTPPLRLTRRGRVVLVVAAALLSLGGFWLGTRTAGHAAVHVMMPAHAGLPWVEVREGDTLRVIADALSRGGDPAVLVEEIKRLNGLPDSLIRPGSRLYLPKDEATLR